MKVSKGLCCTFLLFLLKLLLLTQAKIDKKEEQTNCVQFLVNALSNSTKILSPRIFRQPSVKYRGNGGAKKKLVMSLEEFFILLAVEFARKDNKITGSL